MKLFVTIIFLNYNFFKIKSKKYEKIIVISGENLSKKVILTLKEKYLLNSDNLVLYLWIPIERYKIMLSTYKYYSKVFSFEKEVVKNMDLVSYQIFIQINYVI